MRTYKKPLARDPSIDVGYEELDIRCAIVVLKAMVATHKIRVPLLVQLGGDEGWRQAAIRFIDGQRRYAQRGLRPPEPDRFPERDKYGELNEQLDWQERKDNDGRLDREITAHA